MWSEARASEELPREAPWSAAIERALRCDRLSGNLRDLQRLVFILMARARSESDSRWVDDGVREWAELRARLEAAEGSGHGEGGGDLATGTWKARLQAFKRKLARAAQQEHGSYTAAAKALKVSERTLREHADEEKR